MSYTNILNMIAGLALFLYGMNLMGKALEKRAGKKLKQLLSKLAANPFKGFMLGTVVTAIIQSSCATTVTVVGFVNSGLMTLSQSVGIIIGANVGTAVTSWILSLTGLTGSAWYITIFKPTTFTPVIALIGIIIYMFSRKEKKKDTASILLGFSVLMFGMQTMSDSVAPLADVEEFSKILTMFSNPFLGLLMGVAFTAVIQSSSASVGILQALSMTGAIPYSSVVPLLMGFNIGTCVTAIISSSGATVDAKRASMIHLVYNIICAVILLPLFYLLNSMFAFSFFSGYANTFGVAITHTIFKLISAFMMLPFSSRLEKLSRIIVRSSKSDGEKIILDERLFVTPTVAIEKARSVTNTMSDIVSVALVNAISIVGNYNEQMAEIVAANEDRADKYEDALGTYLVKLGEQQLTTDDSHEQSKLLHMIGDFERISDHAANIAESAHELNEKKISFSSEAEEELKVMMDAVSEAFRLSLNAFKYNDMQSAYQVEPLEQVVDILQKQIRARHIERLTKGACSIEQGFILTDILGNLERISDHCSNIAGCVIEIEQNSLDVHSFLNELKSGHDKNYNEKYIEFGTRYTLPTK